MCTCGVFACPVAEEARQAVIKKAYRAVKLLDGIKGWQGEGCLTGLKVAYDVVSSRPTDATSSLTQQIQTAAMGQGLLVPAQQAQAAPGVLPGQQVAGGLAAQQGVGVLAAGAAGLAPQQLVAPQMLPAQMLQQQLLQQQMMQPQLLAPQYMLPQYGGAAPPPAPEVCWRCGVPGHRVPHCTAPRNPANPFPFRPPGRAGPRRT
jgi:hypothetical protein